MHLKEPNLHLKLQEMCDCYMDTGYAAELAHMSTGPGEDPEEDAVKYLALAIMYGITEKADKLKLKRKENGTVKASLKAEEKISLPPPTGELFDRVVNVVRRILHFEEGSGELPLSLGLRAGSVDLTVKVKEKEGETSLKIAFPR